MEPTPLPAAATVEFEAWPDSFDAEIADSIHPAIVRSLPAGTYRMVVRLAGYHEASANVTVRAATHSECAVELRPVDQAGDSIVRLSTEPIGTVRAFDEAMLDTFPTDDPLGGVVETAVAPLIVDRMANGGLFVGEAALIGGQASSWRHTSIALGDLDVTDPARLGTPLLRPSSQSIDSLVVSTSLLPASDGGPGPALTLVSRAPSRVWQRGVEVGFIPTGLQSDRGPQDVPPIAKFDGHQELAGHVAGPLAPRAGLFVTGRRIASDRVERFDPAPLETSVSSLFVSAVAARSDDQIRVVGSVDRAGIPYAGRARFSDRDVRETNTFVSAQLTWNRAASGGPLWSVSSGMAQGTITPAFAPALSEDPIAAAGTVERLRDGPVPTLFDVMPGTRRRLTARAELTPQRLGWGDRQLLQIGATVARNTAATRGQSSPPVAELVDGVPARIWEYEYRAPESDRGSTELAAYVSDRVMLGPRATLNAGLRLDSARGSARGAANGISWISAEPRIDARWVVARPIAVFGGYARYGHRLALDYLAYGDPAAATGRVYRWNDVNGDARLQAGEYGDLVAVVGPCCNATGPNQIDPDLRRPSTVEGVFGIDLRLAGWSVRLAGVSRREHDLIGSADVGAGDDAYVLRYIPDPGEPFRDPPEERPLPVYDRQPSSFGRDQYLLTNPPDASGKYGGAEVTVDGSIGRRVRTSFDASLYQAWVIAGNRGFHPLENDPGVIGERFENPNAQTYAFGHGFVDRGYVIKWWSQYTAPRNWSASAVARYQDGQPFSRLVIVPDLNQGPEAINGYRLGRTRFTFTFTLDTHLEKTFSTGRARMTGVLDVFNLLDTSNEVEEDVAMGPTFRTSTAVQPPRAVRVGVRVAF